MSDTTNQTAETQNAQTDAQAPVNADTTETFTKDDLTSAIEKARQQEKDKLYQRLSDIDAKNQEYSSKLSETTELLQKLVAERDEAKEKLEAQRQAEMSAEELVAERLKALEERERNMQAQLERVAEEAALRVRESELKLFKANKISESKLTLTELVSGDSEEEIMNSIERAKAREDEIFSIARERARAELTSNLPKPTTPSEPTVTADASANQRINPADKFKMANLSTAEFAKLKAELLQQARSQL